ncbi:hypothetical protein F9L06_24970 [Brucella anthropi]|uniref:Cupin domain-containing protein n=1 Tax=Brucella anthropi TaxID=529 RepID=A0A6I0DI89_BRUAN|nr:hypothetical protein [Brucella anthropi]KAB2790326.1 hypothetical protein F9L06_24970 [Brucella anthropi]
MSNIATARPSYFTGATEKSWAPLLISKSEIDLEVERLLDEVGKAEDRAASFVHPRATDGVPSLTPVTEVSVNVLKPGERTAPRRGNYSLIETTISGRGTVHAGGAFLVEEHDVWTVPAMQVYSRVNTGTTPWVWLTYSNSAILRRTGGYWDETLPEGTMDIAKKAIVSTSKEVAEKYTSLNAPSHILPTSGANLRGYEFLTDIEPVRNPALHWAWKDMAPYLPIHAGDNNDPAKRGIWLMYNPATERRQGTTPNHFATYGGAAPGTPPYKGKRGHFHISASINYHIRGYGYSLVGGERIDWKQGDLLFSAPSWVEHAHYHGEEGWTVLTVQDHPLHISMGSLLWQENPDDPILSLGNEKGQTGYVGPRKAGD